MAAQKFNTTETQAKNVLVPITFQAIGRSGKLLLFDNYRSSSVFCLSIFYT